MALLLQALIFGDGGILAFGANCFNMAFVLPFVGYAVTHLIAPKFGTEESTKKRDLIAAGVGSYCGLNAAALCAAIEFGIQPMLFTDAAGNALYCPYGLGVAIPAMMIGHLTIFGLVEVIFTCAILAFVRSAAPEMQLSHAASHTSTPLKVFLGALILATPIGLLATGTAWGEWGADEIADTGIGYTPQGMLDGFQFEAIIPDYSVAGMPEWIGYILSAVIGAACLIILFKLASLLKKGSSAA
jgi:cobalt/nickel transport system permease protein